MRAVTEFSETDEILCAALLLLRVAMGRCVLARVCAIVCVCVYLPTRRRRGKLIRRKIAPTLKCFCQIAAPRCDLCADSWPSRLRHEDRSDRPTSQPNSREPDSAETRNLTAARKTRGTCRNPSLSIGLRTNRYPHGGETGARRRIVCPGHKVERMCV